MKKANRLSKNWQFQAIIENNQQVLTKYLVIYYLANGEAVNRVGISISKKFANAVERNRHKRQMRAAIDQLQGQIDAIVPKQDLVVILRKPFLDANFAKKKLVLAEALTLLGKETIGKIKPLRLV